MATDAIMRLKNSVLFEQLQRKEKELDDSQLSELIVKIVRYVSPILATVGSHMPEYTLHDANHSAKVVEMMASIIPEEVISELNIIELTLLILSGYLHDVGMSCSNEEKDEIIKNDSVYKLILNENLDRKILLKNLIEKNDYNEIGKIENQVFTEYLRRNHVKRSRQFIQEKLTDNELKLHWNEAPLWKYLIQICDSHELPVGDLHKLSRNELVRSLRVNVQYLSLILRLGDILDLDPERTPKSLWEFENPKNEKSIMEWKKHRSIIGWDISPEKIEFSAECSHPSVERALKEFLEWIEIERKESLALTMQIKDDISSKYRLNLINPVTTDRVHSDDSYIYSNFRFSLDYKRVMDILMGQRLYKNPSVALRELLQNAFDTMQHRLLIDNDNYQPLVKVTYEDNYLIVEDNGMGMDEHIFEKYFMNIGKSYYSSGECEIDKRKLDVTSEFGIGVLSVFMIAESIEVESRKYPNDPLLPPPPIHIEIPKAYDYFIQRKSSRRDIGTKIKLKLKDKNPFLNTDIRKIIEELVPFPKFPIEITYQQNKNIHNIMKEESLENAIGDIILKIPVQQEKNGIDGVFFIVKGRDRDGVFKSYPNYVAQRGFNIRPTYLSNEFYNYDERKRIEKLLPKWVSVVPFINLSKEFTLSLTPDRSDFLIDEKFIQVSEKIENIIINSIDDFIKENIDKKDCEKYYNFFNPLLKKCVIKGDYDSNFSLSEKSRKFLLEIMPIRVINHNGEIEIQSCNSLLGYKHLLMISDYDYHKISNKIDFIRNVTKKIGNDLRIILDENNIYGRDALLNEFFGEINGELITNISSVSCSMRIKNEYVKKFILFGRVHFNNNLVCAKTNLEVFMLAPSRYSFCSFIFNSNHSLFSSFSIKGNGIEKRILDLEYEIKEIFKKYVTEISNNSCDIEWHKEIQKNISYNFYLENIFSKCPLLLEELNKICRIFFESEEVLKINNNKEYVPLTTDDFPWFWA